MSYYLLPLILVSLFVPIHSESLIDFALKYKTCLGKALDLYQATFNEDFHFENEAGWKKWRKDLLAQCNEMSSCMMEVIDTSDPKMVEIGGVGEMLVSLRDYCRKIEFANGKFIRCMDKIESDLEDMDLERNGEPETCMMTKKQVSQLVPVVKKKCGPAAWRDMEQYPDLVEMFLYPNVFLYRY